MTLKKNEPVPFFRERGEILILTLFVMLFIFILITALADLIGLDLEILDNHLRSTQANYIAEAGIEDGIYRLTIDRNYTVTNALIEFPAGSGSSYILNVAGTVQDKTITSTGSLADFRPAIKVKARIKGETIPYPVEILSYSW